MIDKNTNVVRSFCSECKKKPIRCKSLCTNCYQKKHRTTAKAKERIRLYNLTGGKEANKRFREKNKVNKPIKLPKKDCECGKMSVIKGLCMTCYRKYYQRKKNGYNGGVVKKNKYDTENIFKKVLAEVKNGLTIEKACYVSNVNRSMLYKVISSVQKRELNFYKRLGFVDDEFEDGF